MPEGETGAGPVVRYPGGKQRLLRVLGPLLPARNAIEGRYIEPFVGGAAVFLYLRPRRALISDSNTELVQLYEGLRDDPSGVWAAYAAYGESKEDYHYVRALDPASLTGTQRAARLLFLNRTCFKGNWRHNSKGEFNIGYGGQSRRWVITEEYLFQVAQCLAAADLRCDDFGSIVDKACTGDFLFLDPPYRRGERELINDHYAYKHFSFDDQRRLAAALRHAAARGARWIMTNSSHPEVLALFHGFWSVQVRFSKSRQLSGEVIIASHEVSHAEILR